MRMEPKHTTVTGGEERCGAKTSASYIFHLSRQRILNDHCKQVPDIIKQ